MSESTGLEVNGGQLQDFTIDQMAGALALSLSAVGGLLMVIWKSRCLCRCRLGCSDTCYIFDCSREPPPVESKEEEDSTEEETIVPPPRRSKRLERLNSQEPEPEPEPEIELTPPNP